MILYNRLSKADGLSPEQRMTLKLMLMRMAVLIGDRKNVEHCWNEITASGCGDQNFHRHVNWLLKCSYGQKFFLISLTMIAAF